MYDPRVPTSLLKAVEKIIAELTSDYTLYIDCGRYKAL